MNALTSAAARPVWYVAGAAATTALIAIAAFHIGAFAVGQQEATEHTVHAGPFRTLSLRTDSGDVAVRPAAPSDPPGAVVVDARRVGSFALPAVDVDRAGDRLALDGRCRLPFDGATNCEVSFVVRVPAGLRLRIDTRSGDVEVGDVRISDLAADTGSGDIRATGGLLGAATFRTGSGEATLVGLTGGSVDVRTGSGRIDADGLRVADLVLDTGSGQVDTEFAAPPTRVDARTGSGRVVVRVPSGEGYDVDVDTSSGASRVGVRTDSRSTRSIRAKTGSGDVEIAYTS